MPTWDFMSDEDVILSIDDEAISPPMPYFESEHRRRMRRARRRTFFTLADKRYNRDWMQSVRRRIKGLTRTFIEPDGEAERTFVPQLDIAIYGGFAKRPSNTRPPRPKARINTRPGGASYGKPFRLPSARPRARCPL